MTVEELHQISTEAMLAAVAAHGRNRDERWPSDFGRRARAWERLADSVEALRALLQEDARSATAEPLAMAVA